ncbi:MAG: quinone-dependent dihydroorotate dehydrogenase [Anaerolineales bacterium]|nr:MAG: quinone-dependent dihydroorotate dehydrogenase [Anaerolineales bacterium]
MYPLLRSFLFRLEPERAHALTLFALRLTGASPLLNWTVSRMFHAPEKPVDAFGLRFKNPVGLAAGYDKDGLAIAGLAALGFGHVEVGTVTPLAQDGNPKPRVFRLVEDEAVINRMGFPGRGADFLRRRIKPVDKINLLQRALGTMPKGQPTILGVNLGRNKSTPNEDAVLDYLALVQDFSPYADFLTINISSPNTAGLRELQGRDALEGLLVELHAQRQFEETKLGKQVPILVKLSPDLTDAELDDAVEVILRASMDGIIVTNTTLAREGLRSAHQRESGGLSGAPLAVKSEAVLRQTVRLVNGEVPIVSVGGIMRPEDAKRRLDLGAALVQIYTGMIYRGPSLVKEIVKAI